MKTGLLWFRSDLRLADNPALARALAECERIVPVYILEPRPESAWPLGSASRWWLHHSLLALDGSLRERGSRLIIRSGPVLPVLETLLTETGGSAVYWNRRYEPSAIASDTAVKARLIEQGMTVGSCNAALLAEPWEIGRDGGKPYRVFTPYWKALVAKGWEQRQADMPERLPPLPGELHSLAVADLGLLPKISWDAGLTEAWTPGETGAQAELEIFVAEALHDYAVGRDLPAIRGTSRLSPHLHFGEIGPRQIAHALAMHAAEAGGAGVDGYLRELGWREFAHHILYHFPHTADAPFDPRFETFDWNKAPPPGVLRAWQRGQTGIPLVDAGMRELWRTGWMHNRVRMVVASFLTKNLRIHWLEGARWFWDTLVDADLANNAMGWQWCAGCGTDATPYFRIFNPVTQGERFDPDGVYVRRWVPELATLPNRYIHQPWTAPAAVLQGCRLRLGSDYPMPIADLKASRAEALAAYRDWQAAPSS